MSKCPYCKNEVTLENIKRMKKGFGFFMQETMYICPHCDTIISIARGKFA